MSPRRHGDAGGSLRVFRHFAWLEVDSVKVALSRPAHQRVTPAVGQPVFQKLVMANRNELNLSAMELVETFSNSLKTMSWIWGGFAIDIYESRLLREHDDLDYLTLNLHSLIPQFSELFTSGGWQVNVLENGDLKVKREGVKIQLGHVELSNKARWTHNGGRGSIWFPSDWLNSKPVNFCGIEIHVVAPEFQFVMLEHPQMLNPNWKYRDKDILAQRYLRSLIEGKGITPQSLFEQVCDAEFQMNETKGYQ